MLRCVNNINKAESPRKYGTWNNHHETDPLANRIILEQLQPFLFTFCNVLSISREMTLSNFLALSGHDVNRGESWCWGLSNNIFISSQTFKLDFTLHCLVRAFFEVKTSGLCLLARCDRQWLVVFVLKLQPWHEGW